MEIKDKILSGKYNKELKYCSGIIRRMTYSDITKNNFIGMAVGMTIGSLSESGTDSRKEG